MIGLALGGPSEEGSYNPSTTRWTQYMPSRCRSLSRGRGLCGAAAAAALVGLLASESLEGQRATAPRAVPRRQREPTIVIDTGRLARIDELVETAIREGKLPGAVVVVGDRDRVVYRKAFGRRAVVPVAEPMTVDTIFDLASLTKVVATAPSVMRLVEEGRLRLSDRVAVFIPEFARYGKAGITVQHLLTHTSGLRPDLDLELEFSGADEAIRRASEEVPLAPPGERFVYSDINFFVLGEIVARVGGMPLDRFARTYLFDPLGMRDTFFNPPAHLKARIAPTEPCRPLGWPCGGPGATLLRGVVHDPTARRMGGVAGHAGLFSTADDLAIFCRMLLGGGAVDGKRVLSPLTVARMTRPATPPHLAEVRALGWDIESPYSANRGDLLPLGSYGHTGFTGTSIWIDPRTELFVIFLSNRVHPDGRGEVTALRGQVATVAAGAVAGVPRARLEGAQFSGRGGGPSAPLPARATGEVLAGVDVLRAEGFARLRGRRVGLVTNQTGRARDGTSTIDLLRRAEGVQLVALFSPEHGLRGTLEEKVPSSREETTGLPLFSLYGETLRPTAAMLQGLDTLVVDLQDIGARFYTYMTTMAYVLEEAAKHQIAVFVLDRPNPINGFQIEGPMLEPDLGGFTGYLPMPIRHGLTMGELARLFNEERRLGADLTVVSMRGWRRDLWFDETGLPWVDPSPNIRNLLQATLYPGLGAIEATNISVGRGTDAPFQQIGAPWIDGVRLAADLNARGLPGIRFYPVAFTPRAAKYAGERCEGVFLVITDREALRPVRVGVEIAAALHRLYGARFDLEATARLLGSRELIRRIRAGDDPARLAAEWAADEARWRLRVARYLLYH
jgi:uncharacterized protein YbbC (DUF1343 family)/CubicO group peptidase (beta-lactamase class C family)